MTKTRFVKLEYADGSGSFFVRSGDISWLNDVSYLDEARTGIKIRNDTFNPDIKGTPAEILAKIAEAEGAGQAVRPSARDIDNAIGVLRDARYGCAVEMTSEIKLSLGLVVRWLESLAREG